jgi:hypothetical protein
MTERRRRKNNNYIVKEESDTEGMYSGGIVKETLQADSEGLIIPTPFDTIKHVIRRETVEDNLVPHIVIGREHSDSPGNSGMPGQPGIPDNAEVTLAYFNDIANRRDSRLRLRISQDSPYMPDRYQMYIFIRREGFDRDSISIARSITMETREYNPNSVVMQHDEGAMRLDRDTLQELMNELWILGFRPAGNLNQNTQEVALLRDEITYLRTLVQRLTNAPDQPSATT